MDAFIKAFLTSKKARNGAALTALVAAAATAGMPWSANG